MANHDSSVVIHGELETEAVEKGAKKIADTLDKVSKKAEKTKIEVEWTEADQKAAEAQIEAIFKQKEQEAAAAKNSKTESVDEEGWNRVEKEIDYAKIEAERERITQEIEAAAKATDTVSAKAEKEAAAAEKRAAAEEKAKEKEAERQAKLKAERDEQERLESIRANAIVSDQNLVELLEKQAALGKKLADLKKAGLTEGYQEYDETAAAIERTKEQIRNLKQGIDEAKEAAKELHATMQKETQKTNGFLGKMASRLKGIALSLFVFSWIRKGFNAMVSAAKTGFQSLAKYSRDYNAAMSATQSECAQVKYSLAAAFEPIATTVLPYITRLISGLNKAIEAMGKFLAIISGKSTYTRAKQQVIDYAKSLNTASKSAQGALAAFDDINVLQKNESDTGAGGELTGADAFETAAITDEDVSLFEKVKEIIGDILELLILVGATMAILGVGGPLTGIIGTLLIILGLLEFISGYLDAWENGVSFDNLKTSLLGLMAILLGIYLLFGPMALGIAMIIGGIALLVLAIKDIVENGLTMKNCILLIVGAVVTMIGIFIAFGSTAAVAVAAVVGGIAMVVLAIKDMLENGVNMQNSILLAVGCVAALIGIFVLFGSTAAMIVGAIVAVIAIFAAMIAIAGNGQEAIATLKSMFKNFADFFKKIFAGDVEGALESLKAAGKDFVNIVIIMAESLVNCIIKGLNWLIDKINSIHFEVPDWVPVIGGKTMGPNIPKVNEVSLPRLATGGITNGPTRALIGEAGREAVLPLENNTGWMDDLADKLAARIPSGGGGIAYLQIDGKTFGKLALPYIKSENSRIGVSFSAT